MKKALVTGSGVDAADRCPPSAILPRSRHFLAAADFGSAAHEFRHQLARLGAENALAMLPTIARRWELTPEQTSRLQWLCKSFTWMPPPGALTELALGLFADGSVRGVVGGQGTYEVPDDCLLPMTLDLVWSEPEPLAFDPDGSVRCPEGSMLWVIDYKTGEGTYLAPTATNGQLLCGALLGARFTGAERVVPGIIYMDRGDGQWDMLDHWLGADHLDDIAEQLTAIVARVEEQQQRLLLDEPLDYGVGEHCTFCPAAWCCPTKTAAIRAWLAPAQLVKTDREMIREATIPAPLSEEDAERLASYYPQLTAFVEQAKQVMEAHVKATGRAIRMKDGRQWGPQPWKEDEVVVAKALPILRELLGEQHALQAVGMTKAAVERAVVSAQSESVTAPTIRQVFGRLRKDDAIVTHQTKRWGVHKPKASDG